MAYYQQTPRPERGTFSYTYPQDNISYAYTATSTSPQYPSGSGNPDYYPPSSTKQRTSTAYYPPSSSAAFQVPGPAAPRRRSSSFSTPAPAEVLYRHINGGPGPSKQSTPAAATPRSSSKSRRFSKSYANADDYEYLYGDDHLYVSDDNEDEYVYGYDKEKLSQRFDRGRSGLRRSATVTERLGRSKSRQDRDEDGLGLGIGGLKIVSSSSSSRPRDRDRERSLPRAPRPPAPPRASPPPPAPMSSLSTESNRSRRSGHHGVSFVDDPMVIPIRDKFDNRVSREERKEKSSWMNINGNKIVVDHKGVKINGQRYDAPGGKGVFTVCGIKIRVDGGNISLC